MQAAFAAIASIFGGGGAAATGAAATGGATAAGLSGAQTLVSVLSAIGTLGAGFASAQASKDQANAVELQAGQDKVQDTQRQTQMKRTLLQVLGDNDVTFASAGIDISGGIAQDARQTASKRAADELTIDRRDSDFRMALAKMRAQGYRRQASSTIGGALLGAAGGMLNSYIDGQVRGLPDAA
ncbi:hypothetical protein EN817_17655 [Mesorhizobium sp. M3A.F.Ca.ET.174.01.1.1]|uniref:hypothetical protein n=1 Tax=unclassified Mesorhizobium TaxID=325217 RepID=UPI0010937CD4|nr:MULTISPECIES: hypothetical protein [unclassified Mesorhizobium]TGS86728.1 hypothetical protein EN818_15510 [Mesorhizobium sp. M3A.F.Ca.ET.175.01.1.1]TGT25176.1 hypothetical protein EN817_17655 [Mesorhizobium sp. M3A.F.Ca.ET.174.01.1.1]